MPIASLKPFRKTAPSSAISTSVTATSWPCSEAGMNGFSTTWAVGVGGREGDRDDEAGGDEAEQAQDEELALPPGQQALQHRDRAVAVRALAGDAAVHRQRAEERDQHQDQGRDRRERAGGEGGDAGLVAERREVVDAGQAHHLPPGMLVVRQVARVRPFHLVRLSLQQPFSERFPRSRWLARHGLRRGHCSASPNVLALRRPDRIRRHASCAERAPNAVPLQAADRAAIQSHRARRSTAIKSTTEDRFAQRVSRRCVAPRPPKPRRRAQPWAGDADASVAASVRFSIQPLPDEPAPASVVIGSVAPGSLLGSIWRGPRSRFSSAGPSSAAGRRSPESPSAVRRGPVADGGPARRAGAPAAGRPAGRRIAADRDRHGAGRARIGLGRRAARAGPSRTRRRQSRC